MPSINPLSMQEIVDVIGSYLIAKDLARSILVSKDWHNLFLPSLWRTVRLDTQKDPDTVPQLSTIHHHRRLVRSLCIEGDPYGFPDIHNPALAMLESIDLTETFPLLVSLVIDGAYLPTAAWSTLPTHRHLRSIYVSWIDIVDTAGFWRACMNLEQVHLSDCAIPNAAIPEDVEFPRMRVLRLECISLMNGANQLEVFLRSPNLEAMKWITSIYHSPRWTNLSTQIQNRHWPHLHTLHIECELEDTDLISILNSVGNDRQRLGSFCLQGSGLRTRPFHQLATHFDTLVSLDITESYSTTSPMIQELLCSCPKLGVLRVGSVLARDVTTGAPWCCQRLQELYICFRFGALDQDLHPLVIDRLSTLVRLKRLILYQPSYDELYEGYNMLKLRLDSGLSKLATLQHLTDIEFGCIETRTYYPQMDMEEVDWMVDNLKSLSSIVGSLNANHEENRRLTNALRQRGVTVR